MASILNIDTVRKSSYNTAMTNTTTWQVTLESVPDSEELILPLPQELLDLKGWQEGDTLNWIDNGDGTWTLVKA